MTQAVAVPSRNLSPYGRLSAYVKAVLIKAAVAFCLFSVAVPHAEAHWLTKLLKEAGDTSGDVARHADVPNARVGRTPALLKNLDNTPDHALAATATPEGHWQFTNKKGEVFTAGAPDEMQRVMPTLAKEASGVPMVLYIGEETVGTARAALDLLPANARLHLVGKHGTFPLSRSAGGWQANVRPNLSFRLGVPELDHEAFALLARRLNRSEIRTLSVASGGPKSLSSAPRLDPASKLPQVDRIDPAHMGDALRSLRGQTAMLVGRVEDGMISFGSGQPRAINDLIASAREADVNLIVLNVPSARQPGGRNWFWQKIGVPGLDEASKNTQFADFLEVLAGREGRFDLSAGPGSGNGRFQLRAVSRPASLPLIDDAGSWLGDAVEFVTGNVLPNAITMDVRDYDSQLKQDMKIIPWLPLWLQVVLFLSIISGFIAFGVVREWWAKVWPRTPYQPGKSLIIHWLSQVPRRLVMVLFFLPVVGLPALLTSLLRPAIWLIRLPVRLFSWLFTRRTA